MNPTCARLIRVLTGLGFILTHTNCGAFEHLLSVVIVVSSQQIAKPDQIVVLIGCMFTNSPPIVSSVYIHTCVLHMRQSFRRKKKMVF